MMTTMRSYLILITSFFLLAAATTDANAQAGADRRGGDYARFEVRSGDPEACAARCEREPRCRAWTFSYPAGGQAMCWLKSQVMPRIEDSCCVSGIKGGGVAEPHKNEFEYAIDRFGGDYRDFQIASDPTGTACKAACEGDNRCRTWTYVRPGYLGSGAAARCYLKDRITPPRRKPCCISGVVR